MNNEQTISLDTFMIMQATIAVGIIAREEIKYPRINVGHIKELCMDILLSNNVSIDENVSGDKDSK